MVDLITLLFSIEKDYTPNPEKHRRGLALLLEKKDAALFVAEAGEESLHGSSILGMVTVQLSISTAEGSPSAVIEDLFVEEKCRRQGIAKALLEAVETWCISMGAHRIQLLCDSGNARAIRFYDAHGYSGTRMVMRRHYIE